MSHSRSNRPQQQRPAMRDQMEMNRNQRDYASKAEHAGQNQNFENRPGQSRNANPSDSQSNDWRDDWQNMGREEERFGGQSGYAQNQGDYGRQGGYRQINYPEGQHEESDFSFGGEYIQDNSEFRPSRMSRETGNRSWIGVGESANSGDQGGRSYTSTEYHENPSYRGGSSGFERGGMSRNLSRGDFRNAQTSRENYRDTSANRPSFAGRGPQGYSRSDERITEDINERLTQDHDVDATGISVETKGGEVVLKGTVTDRESKRRAEEIAESCSGVKDVQNQLRIKREETSESANESQRGKTDDKRTKLAS